MAGRFDFTALFYLLRRQPCNITRVIRKERDMREERTSAGNHTPIRQNIAKPRGSGNARLSLKEGAKAGFHPKEAKMKEQKEARKKMPDRIRWTEKLAKSFPNFPTVMPHPLTSVIYGLTLFKPCSMV